jgi:alpha-mannosidase
MHNSKAYIRYQLPRNGTDFDIEVGVSFQEKNQYLKLLLNTAEKDNDFSGQIMFGRELLRQGEETVSQKWVMVSGKAGRNAVAVLNKGTYGASLRKDELGITLLRSAGYSAADSVMGKTLQEEQWAPRMEQGERFYQFKITAGNEKELGDRLDQLAQAYNEEPYAFAYCPPGYTADAGNDSSEGLLHIDNPKILLSAMKKSEDRDGYILRFYESSGENTKADISFLHNRIKETIIFKAFEIKTFFLSVSEGKLEETTLIEMI